MSSITNLITSLEQYDIEIKRLSKQLKDLRTHRAKVQEEITQYFVQNNLPGGKFKGKEFRIQTQEVPTRKPAKHKNQDMIDLLASKGIRNPKELLEELKAASYGPSTERHKIKIKNLK